MKKRLLLALFLSSMGANISALNLPNHVEEALNNSRKVKVQWKYNAKSTATFILTKENRHLLDKALITYRPMGPLTYDVQNGLTFLTVK